MQDNDEPNDGLTKWPEPGDKPRFAKAEKDVIALGIAIAAIILFVGTGGTLMPQIVRSWYGVGEPPDMLLTNAVLLNIALVIFGWRRYDDLNREVKVRRKAEEVARQMAEIDPLTGCRNRRSGLPSIEDLREVSAAQGNRIAVLMIDLDNFKQINDVHGHQVGDRVLATIARRIEKTLAAHTGSSSVMARIGGDEFICAIPFPLSKRQLVDHITSELIDNVSAIIEDRDLRIVATVSIGIAYSVSLDSADDPVDADMLVYRADIAMYHAKKRGRNRYFWFEQQMEDELRFRNDLETGIRRGVSEGEFVPYYEQQIDLETGDLVGFEMLARWHSPQYGVVSPEIFIPVAEEIDLIAELSESLIRQALEDAKKWDPSLTLSVNISPIQLRDPWFAQKLLHILLESGFPPQRFEIEITESCLLENLSSVRAMISSLKNQGIRISLDDFGTGYSSLSQLRSLPFDRIKIDRSFISALRDGGNATEVVQAIVSLGKSLSLPLTAEGVESAEVLALLKAMGQIKGQGYFYGHPEDAKTTEDRLAHLKLLASCDAGPGSSVAAGSDILDDVRHAG